MEGLALADSDELRQLKEKLAARENKPGWQQSCDLLKQRITELEADES